MHYKLEDLTPKLRAAIFYRQVCAVCFTPLPRNKRGWFTNESSSELRSFYLGACSKECNSYMYLQNFDEMARLIVYCSMYYKPLYSNRKQHAYSKDRKNNRVMG